MQVSVIPSGWTPDGKYVILQTPHSGKKRQWKKLVRDRLQVLLQILQDCTDDDTWLKTGDLLRLMEEKARRVASGRCGGILMAEQAGLSKSGVRSVLSNLREKGIVTRTGNRKEGRWEINDANCDSNVTSESIR